VIRLLIFLALGYLIYRVVRSLLASRKKEEMEGRVRVEGVPRRVDDELVQDPVCRTYVPLKEAERRSVNGKVYYFCSRACAEKFLAEGAGGQEDRESGTRK
jgi:YHS domain-containing protein